jgi:large subunit ribosomal protein L15
LPKFGFRNINRIDYQEINLDLLHKYVEKYSTKEFSPEILSKLKLFNTKAKLKILGRGEAAPGLKIKIHACTASAKAKIEAAGGTIEII